MYTQCFLLGIGCDHAQQSKELAELLFTLNSGATQEQCDALANRVLESFDLAPKGTTKFVNDAYGAAFQENLTRQGLLPADRVISRPFEPEPFDRDDLSEDPDHDDEPDNELIEEPARLPEDSPNRVPEAGHLTPREVEVEKSLAAPRDPRNPPRRKTAEERRREDL